MAGTGRTRTQRDTGTRRADKAGSRRVPVAPKGNPALLYGGIGGGALLLIILIAVAASGGKKEKPVARPRQEAPVLAEPKKERIDTGAIMFVCANSDKHPDEEMKVGLCPCGARARFYVDKAGDGYRCVKCSKIYDNARIKCDKCGKVAVKTHLKPIPD